MSFIQKVLKPLLNSSDLLLQVTVETPAMRTSTNVPVILVSMARVSTKSTGTTVRVPGAGRGRSAKSVPACVSQIPAPTGAPVLWMKREKTSDASAWMVSMAISVR